jgi:hypothetical protein
VRQAEGIHAQVWHVPYLLPRAGAEWGIARCKEIKLVKLLAELFINGY